MTRRDFAFNRRHSDQKNIYEYFPCLGDDKDVSVSICILSIVVQCTLHTKVTYTSRERFKDLWIKACVAAVFKFDGGCYRGHCALT